MSDQPPPSDASAVAFDAKHFRTVLGHFPTGVTVITRMAEGLTIDERDVVGPDLFEVERSLRAARRRVSRMADSAR